MKVTGPGIKGTIIVKFNDSRPAARAALASLNASETLADSVKEYMRAFWTEQTELTDDEAIETEWVRWVPEEPIPLTWLTGKYGVPDTRGFNDQTFEPYRQWTKRAVLASIGSDTTMVRLVEFQYTKTEYARVYHDKFGVWPYGYSPPEKGHKRVKH